jgi:hypothetical protein
MPAKVQFYQLLALDFKESRQKDYASRLHETSDETGGYPVAVSATLRAIKYGLN